MTPLRQRMLEDMQIRNLSPLTQRAYVEHISRFARYVGRSPAVLGPEEIRAYLVYLTTERHLAPSTIIIAVAALRFLYTVASQVSSALPRVARSNHGPISPDPSVALHRFDPQTATSRLAVERLE